MKFPKRLVALFLCPMFGCVSEERELKQGNEARSVPTGSPESTKSPTANKQVTFQLTAEAKNMLTQLMQDGHENSWVVVGVNVSNEGSLTGFRYELDLQRTVDESRYARTQSRGLKIAVANDDVQFLEGTTLTWAQQADGREGFLFYNPNERSEDATEK